MLGLHVYPELSAVPEPPDVAVVATPAPTVPAIVAECAERGVKGAVIPAGHFRQTGPEGARLEADLAATARRTGIRIVGPNTSGIINAQHRLNLVGVRDVPVGGLSLLSQSGNVALEFFTEMARWDAGLAIYVGVGNETDIAFHEYLDFLEHHEPTKAIAVYVEGFREGRAFIEAARRVSRVKPIVLLKGGRTDVGVAAARSHTGAIAGSYPVLRATLRQGGVSEVHRSDELVPVTRALAYQPPVPVGKGVVVVSDGGGHGTLAADALQTLGAPLATLTPATVDELRSLLGGSGRLDNPIDLAGAADRDPTIFARVVDLVMRDANTGGVFVVGLFGGYAIRFAESLAAAELEAAHGMIASARRANVPLVVHTLYAPSRTEPLRALGQAHVQVVRSVEIGSRCFRALHARGLLLAERPVPRATPTFQRMHTDAIVRARSEGRLTLLEPEVRTILEQEGVPLIPATFCRTTEQLLRCVAEHEPPFAIKVVSANISHKSQAGGVALDIEGADDARAAFEQMIESVSRYAASHGIVPGIRGVLIMPMLPRPVAEVLVGVKHDPHFGAVLSVGSGGVYVEVHQDIALRALPVGRAEVLEMLAEIRLSRILRGYRGQAAADREALADTILRIAATALSHPDIEELEANPVFAYSDRAVAVDCRAFLRNGNGNGNGAPSTS